MMPRRPFLVRSIATQPLFFLALDVLLIPSFASFYWTFIPHDFYAPYAHLEQAAVDDRANLTKILESRLTDVADYTVGPMGPARTVAHVLDLHVTDDEKLDFHVTLTNKNMQIHGPSAGIHLSLSGEGLRTRAQFCRPVDMEGTQRCEARPASGASTSVSSRTLAITV